MASSSLRGIVGLGLGLSLALGGCSDRFIVQDGVLSSQFDLERALNLEVVDLHAPYVRGARLSFLVIDRLHSVDFEGWTLDADDPAIAEVLEVKVTEHPRSARRPEASQSALSVKIRAVDVGETTLVLRDRQGDARAEVPFEVAAPDRFQLLAAAPLLVAPETHEEVEVPRVVTGGAAAFLLRYFDGDRPLHGTLDVEAAPPPGSEGLDVEGFKDLEADVHPFHFLSYDWVRVHVQSQGIFPIELTHDGALLHVLEVEGVSPGEIATLELHGVDEARVAYGETRQIALRARDGAARPLHGVVARWTADDLEIDEGARGDLVSYERADRLPITLTAHVGELALSTQVHGEAFHVRSSSDVEWGDGCSIDARHEAPWPSLILVGLAARRRRSAAAR